MVKGKKIGLGVLLILMFTLGWLCNIAYYNIEHKRIYNGFYARDVNTKTAFAYAHKLDAFGDWVCVNVRGMSFEEGLATCNHEVGHEIFAEYCEESNDTMNNCIEVTK